MRINRWGPALALALLFGDARLVGAQPVWSGLEGGAGWEVRGLRVFDEDGSGPMPPALFAVGGFSTLAQKSVPFIARWDGWAASSVGGGCEADSYGLAEAFGVLDLPGQVPDGLYAGGKIEAAGGIPVNNLARWLPSQWNDVGGGITRGTINAYNYANDIYLDGSTPGASPALFIGGTYSHAGGIEIESLARWDGIEWAELGGGISTGQSSTTATVYAMAIFDDDGPGPRPPALYIGGKFSYAGGVSRQNIARWDGQNWESVGAGLNGVVYAFCEWDEDGPGPQPPALFAGGSFTSEVGGAPYSLRKIARWDGKNWTPVGGWLSDGSIRALLVADEDGPGPAKECLFAGGLLNTLPDLTPASGVARWDGAKWTTVGELGVHGFGSGTSVSAMAFFDEDGPGPNPGGLYVGGLFYYADGVYSKHIARWGEPLPPAPNPSAFAKRVPTCAPDCEKDGDLDLFDFLCFQGRFADGDPYCDFDADGDLDLFDFLEFQDQFVNGCE